MAVFLLGQSQTPYDTFGCNWFHWPYLIVFRTPVRIDHDIMIDRYDIAWYTHSCGWYSLTGTKWGKSPGLSLLNEAFLDQLPPEERQEIVHKGSMVDGSAPHLSTSQGLNCTYCTTKGLVELVGSWPFTLPVWSSLCILSSSARPVLVSYACFYTKARSQECKTYNVGRVSPPETLKVSA